MARRVVGAIGLSLALCWLAPAVDAQGTEPNADAREAARDLDRRARSAFEAGRFREAAELFDRANLLVPHPATHFNGALAWDRAGELPRAADAYEIALGLEGLSAEMATAARDRLSVLKRQLGYLVVPGPIGGNVSVAHARDVPIPAKVHVQPGTHTVRVRKPDGRIESKRLAVLAGATATVQIAATPGLAPARPAAKPDRVEPVADGSVRRTVGWITLGTGAALGVTAGVLGVQTLEDRDRCVDTLLVSDCDQARSMRLWTNLAAGAALVSGGIGLYLLLSAEDAPTRVEVGPTGVRARVNF